MSKVYRTVPAADVIGRFSKERRVAIDARAKEMIAEEYALRDLRKAKQLTQVEVAEALGGRQAYVSRLERRADMKLSTLHEYVRAIGGRLQLLVTFPNDQPARLKDIGAKAPASRRPGRRKTVVVDRKGVRRKVK